MGPRNPSSFFAVPSRTPGGIPRCARNDTRSQFRFLFNGPARPYRMTGRTTPRHSTAMDTQGGMNRTRGTLMLHAARGEGKQAGRFGADFSIKNFAGRGRQQYVSNVGCHYSPIESSCSQKGDGYGIRKVLARGDSEQLIQRKMSATFWDVVGRVDGIIYLTQKRLGVTLSLYLIS